MTVKVASFYHCDEKCYLKFEVVVNPYLPCILSASVANVVAIPP